MAVYAQDLYGKSFYGADVTISFSVGPVSAVQSGYGEITLRWTTPTNTENWSVLRLVRNTAGYPSSEEDGDILLDITSAQPQISYTDSGLIGGRYYYYTFFLASAFPAYSAGSTYQPGDTVSSGGSNWVCTASNTLGITPAVSAQWAATNEAALWNRAGETTSLAVADYGYRALLTQLTPRPYSSGNAELSAPDSDESGQLYQYLSVLAWALDMARTELGEEEHLHRVETMPLDRMERLALELGAGGEASITPRLRRYRVANASQLGRRKGTLESVKEAVYAATGYDVEFSTSVNRLLDADQAEFRYPRFPAWDPSVVYLPGAVVSYGGFLYTAVPNSSRIEAEATTISLTGTPSYTVQGNAPTVTYSGGQQILARSNAVGQSITLTFSIPVTGTYDFAVGATKGFDYATVGFAVDGTTILSLVNPPGGGTRPPLAIDMYAPAANPATSIYLGSFAFTAGNHTVTLTAVGKNPSSGKAPGSVNNGYQMGIDYFIYTPRGATSIVAFAPSGAATSNSFWTYYTGIQSHALDNTLTGGISTWEQVSFTAGATPNNASFAVYSGYTALNGLGDHTANLGVMTNSTGVVATLGAHSIPHAKVAAWDSSVTYRANSYVSYQGTNYLALLPTQGDQPDADLTHWAPEVISTTGPDRFLVSSYGLPLAHTPVWSAGTTYAPGALVQYGTQRYTASAASHGSAPTGQPTDNLTWAWADTAQDTYTASAWTALYGGGTTTTTRSMYIEYYDTSGTLITSIGPTANTQADLLVPFARNSTNLVTDPGSKQELNGLTWVSSTATDTPVAFSGLAYWATRNETSVNGRHLVVDYSTGNISAGITFMTAPPANVEHGLLFRWSSLTNFWAASRTRLTKTVSGTQTTLATWSALPDGSRIFITLQGSAIAVFSYQGPGLAPVQLATVTDSALAASTRYGIFERPA